jgi:hypothetical protein
MNERKVCPKCGLEWKARDPADGRPYWPIDPCLGVKLPGVIYFCCGHGNGYGAIKFENGVMFRFGSMELWDACRPGDSPIFDLGSRP